MLLHAPGFAAVFLGPWLLMCWRIWCLHVWLRWPVNATSSRSNNAPREGGWPQPIAAESAKLRVRWAGRTSFVLVCRLLWPKKPQEGFHTTWMLLWTGRAARTGGTALPAAPSIWWCPLPARMQLRLQNPMRCSREVHPVWLSRQLLRCLHHGASVRMRSGPARLPTGPLWRQTRIFLLPLTVAVCLQLAVQARAQSLFVLS